MTRRSLRFALVCFFLATAGFLGISHSTAHRDPEGVGQVNLGHPAWLIMVPKENAYWSTPSELAVTTKFMVGSTKDIVMFVRLTLAMFLAMVLAISLLGTSIWIRRHWNRFQIFRQ